MTLALTPAAVCQCFTLVSLCTSIADPNWIQIQNCSHPGNSVIYGVAFTLHQNHTAMGPLGGENGWGMWLLYSLAALCYTAVLLSSSSFLLDFLQVSVSHSKLVTSLHFSTALSCVAVLAVCASCMSVIEHHLQRGPHPAPCVFPGESLFIEILGLIFSLLACGLTLRPRPEPVRSPDFQSAADSDTEPLIGGAEEEEW